MTPRLIRVKVPRIQHLHPPHHIPILHLLSPLPEPLPGILTRDLPVPLLCPRHPQHGREHLLLANIERRDVATLVLESRQGGTRITLIVRQHLQRKQIRNRTSALWPGTRIKAHVTLVKQHEGALLEVEPVPSAGARETEFVPEAAHQRDPRTLAKSLNLLTVCGLCRAEARVC